MPWPYDDEEQQQYQAQFQQARAPMGAQGPQMGAMPMPAPGSMRQKLASMAPPPDQGGGGMGAAIQGISGAASTMIGKAGQAQAQGRAKQEIGSMTDAGRRGPLQTQEAPAGMGMEGLTPFTRARQVGIPGMARGGRVDEDEAYMVGEEGPETFVPEQPGYIVPNPKTVQAPQAPQGNVGPGYNPPMGAMPQPQPGAMREKLKPWSNVKPEDTDMGAAISGITKAATGAIEGGGDEEDEKHRAYGGYVDPSDSYMVGEQGPEAFVPQQSGSGYIMPHRAPAAASSGIGQSSQRYQTQQSAGGGSGGATPPPPPPPESTGDPKFDAYLRGGGAQAAPSPTIQRASGMLDRFANKVGSKASFVGNTLKAFANQTPGTASAAAPSPSPSPTPSAPAPATGGGYAGTPWHGAGSPWDKAAPTPGGEAAPPDWDIVGRAAAARMPARSAHRRVPTPAGGGVTGITPAPAEPTQQGRQMFEEAQGQPFAKRQLGPGDPTPVPENTDYGFGPPAESQGTGGGALTPQQSAEQNMQSRARMIGTQGLAGQPQSMAEQEKFGAKDVPFQDFQGTATRNRVETEAGRQGQRGRWKRAGLAALQGALAGAAGGGGAAGAIGGAVTGGALGLANRQLSQNMASNIVDIPSQNIRQAREEHQRRLDEEATKSQADLERTRAATAQSQAATEYEKGRVGREQRQFEENQRQFNVEHGEHTREFNITSGLSAKEQEARIKNMSFQQQLQARQQGLSEAEAKQKYGQMTKQQIDEEDRDSKYFADSLFGAPEAINIRGEYQNQLYKTGPGPAAEAALKEETAKGMSANQYAIQGYNQQIIAAKKDALEEAKARYEVETGGYWTEQARKLRRDNHGVMPHLSGQKANYDQIEALRQKYNFRTWDDAARVFRRLGVEVDDRRQPQTGTTAQP